MMLQLTPPQRILICVHVLLSTALRLASFNCSMCIWFVASLLRLFAVLASWHNSPHPLSQRHRSFVIGCVIRALADCVWRWAWTWAWAWVWEWGCSAKERPLCPRARRATQSRYGHLTAQAFAISGGCSAKGRSLCAAALLLAASAGSLPRARRAEQSRYRQLRA